MRLVFDCNVLVRALLDDSSFSGHALEKAESTSRMTPAEKKHSQTR